MSDYRKIAEKALQNSKIIGEKKEVKPTLNEGLV